MNTVATLAQIPAYSEVMEDHAAVEAALFPCAGANAVCIASAGDNVFHLALAGAARVLAVDVMPAQIALARWKQLALRHLDHGDFLTLAGVRDGAEEERAALLGRLPIEDGEHWPHLAAAVARRGLLGCGRLAEFLEPLRGGLQAVVGREVLETLLTDRDLAARRRAFARVESPQGVAFLAAALNQSTIADAFIPAAAWPRMAEPRFHLHYLRVLRHLTLELDPTANPYLQRLWLGRADGVAGLLPYLRLEGQAALRRCGTAIHWVTADVTRALDAEPAASVELFNLSNVPDWCDGAQYEALWRAVDRAAKRGARCFLRSFLAERPLPTTVAPRWRLDEVQSERAAAADRVGYFSRYELWRLG
jgi:S-adenosylmethionine:diacylglycerol 3-amino-3-carboxypropyl transferase